jgi:hypothetical protein
MKEAPRSSGDFDMIFTKCRRREKKQILDNYPDVVSLIMPF